MARKINTLTHLDPAGRPAMVDVSAKQATAREARAECRVKFPADVATHLEWHLHNEGFDLASGPAPVDVVVALRDRVQTLKEMASRAAVWYRPLEHYDDAAVAKHLNATAQAPLSDIRDRLAKLTAWTSEAVDVAVRETAEALGIGMGKVAQPLRVAITGTQVSPDISHTVYLAGQAQALQRIDAALTKVS